MIGVATKSLKDPARSAAVISPAPRIIDLFCGVGGFTLGALRAGFDVVAAVDSDSRVGQTFKANFPECTLIPRDIATLTAAEIEEYAGPWSGRIEGVIGGPPCQGFSCIGHRRATDERNDLFEHFFRLVAELQPLFFVAENVTGILDREFARYRTSALAQVKDYEVLPPITLVSSEFGAPTSRRRAFFIGYLADLFPEVRPQEIRPPSGCEYVTVGTALRGLPTRISPSWQTEELGWRRITSRGNGWFWDRVTGSVPSGVGDPESLRRLWEDGEVSGCLGTRHSPEVVERFAALREGDRDASSRAPRLHRQKPCPTIRSGTGPERGSFQALRPIHPTQPRAITPREAARLQGFPDWFRFDATKWHSFRQIGNSVSPILAEGILRILHGKLTRRE